MRRDPGDYEGQEMELVYVAGKLKEARQVEAILDEAGIDYAIQVEQYRAGVIFASVRAGAFFYVAPETAGRCREVLTSRGYEVQAPTG